MEQSNRTYFSRELPRKVGAKPHASSTCVVSLDEYLPNVSSVHCTSQPLHTEQQRRPKVRLFRDQFVRNFLLAGAVKLEQSVTPFPRNSEHPTKTDAMRIADGRSSSEYCGQWTVSRVADQSSYGGTAVRYPHDWRARHCQQGCRIPLVQSQRRHSEAGKRCVVEYANAPSTALRPLPFIPYSCDSRESPVSSIPGQMLRSCGKNSVFFRYVQVTISWTDR